MSEHKHSEQKSSPDLGESLHEQTVEYVPRSVLNKNRNSIKKQSVQKSFFQYFFSDIFEIKQFANRIPCIKFHFGVVMYANPQLPEMYNARIRNSAKTLATTLHSIVKNAWKSFSKLNYNKLVYLYEFTVLLKNLDKKIFAQPSESILRSIQDIESAYLILSSDPVLISNLQGEFEQYFKKIKNRDFPIDFLIQNISALISTGTRSFNVNTLLQALNILHSRNYCEMHDLLAQRPPILYNKAFFELDDLNNNEMQKFTQSIILNLKQNVEVYQDITLLGRFLPTQVYEDLKHTKHIEQFYDQVRSENTQSAAGSNKFVHDFANVIAFMINFSRKVELAFSSILSGSFHLDGEVSVRIFDPSLFSNFLKRTQYLRDKIDSLSKTDSLLRREYYLSAITQGRQLVERADLVKYITELTAIYFQVSKILSNILYYGQTDSANESLPIIHLIDFKNARFFLPFANKVQHSSEYLAGHTVTAALSTIVRILLSCCALFRETQLMSMITKEKNIAVTIQDLSSELKRLCSVPDFNELSASLKLDTFRFSRES